VLKVILGIKAREECIRSIEEISEKDFSNSTATVGQDKIELVTIFLLIHIFIGYARDQ
jgi:hypothetical protein